MPQYMDSKSTTTEENYTSSTNRIKAGYNLTISKEYINIDLSYASIYINYSIVI